MTQNTETVIETWEQRRDRERLEVNEANRALYHGVVQHLPATWRVSISDDPHEHVTFRYRLVDVAGRTIHLLLQGKRVLVSGYWPQRGANGPYMSPRDLYPCEDSPAITVSADKTHEQIARDIMRRFMPDYVRIWDKLIVKRNEQNAYAECVDALKERVIQTGAAESTKHGGESLWSTFGRIQVNSPDSITLELRSIDSDVALEICRLLVSRAQDKAKT